MQYPHFFIIFYNKSILHSLQGPGCYPTGYRPGCYPTGYRPGCEATECRAHQDLNLACQICKLCLNHTMHALLALPKFGFADILSVV